MDRRLEGRLERRVKQQQEKQQQKEWTQNKSNQYLAGGSGRRQCRTS